MYYFQLKHVNVASLLCKNGLQISFSIIASMRKSRALEHQTGRGRSREQSRSKQSLSKLRALSVSPYRIKMDQMTRKTRTGKSSRAEGKHRRTRSAAPDVFRQTATGAVQRDPLQQAEDRMGNLTKLLELKVSHLTA